jgi:hypothetical protein
MTDERIAEIMGWFPIGPDERMTVALRAETLVLLRQIAREAAQEALQGADVLAEYSGSNGARQWASTGSWLMPGQKIVVLGG